MSRQKVSRSAGAHTYDPGETIATRVLRCYPRAPARTPMDTENSEPSPPDPDENLENEAPRRASAPDAAFNHPKALSEPIAQIERVLAEGGEPDEGIQLLCERAIASPAALIGAASNYLVHLLTGGRLASCPEIPTAYLVEELSHEAVLVTPLLVKVWEESGDQSRLLRLADGLISQASRLKGSDVGVFLLAIAVDLAIQKPVRCLRLIDIARPLIQDPADGPLLTEAEQWQSAGDFLRGDGQKFRSFWQKQFSPGNQWDAESSESAEAVAYLRGVREHGTDIPELFLKVIPAGILNTTTAQQVISERSLDADTLPPRGSAESEPVVMGAEAVSDTKRRPSFLTGFILGGVSMLAVAGWMGKNSILPWIRTSAPAPIAIPSLPSPPAAAPEMVAVTAVVPPVPPPAAVVTPISVPPVEAAPAMREPSAVVAQDLLPTPAPPISAAASAKPADAWRRAEFAALAKQHPAMVRWHQTASTSTWREVQPLLMGMHSFLPLSSEDFPCLIKLLLLDPPRDAEVAEAVPKIAARRLKSSEFVLLLEKLLYPGSPNEKEVRAAAEGFLNVKADTLDQSLRVRLQKLVTGRPRLPAHE